MSYLFKSFKRRKLEREGLAKSRTRQKSSETLSYYFNNSKIVFVLILATLWLAMAFVLLIPSFTGKSEIYLVKGQLAPKTIYSEFSFSYLDPSATKKQKETALHSAPLIFSIDYQISKEMIDKIYNFFAGFPDSTEEQKSAEIQKEFNFKNSDLDILRQIKSDQKRLDLLKSRLSGVIYKGIISQNDLSHFPQPENTEISIITRNRHIRPAVPATLIATVNDASKEFSSSVSEDYSSYLRDALREIVFSISSSYIKPNLIFDESLTNVEKEYLSASDKLNIYNDINKGDILLRKGSIVTQEEIDRLEAYAKELSKKDIYANFLENFSYNLALSFVLLIITFVYYYSIHNPGSFDNQKMGTTVLVLILSLISFFFSLRIFNVMSSEYNIQSTLMICILPLALPSILLTVLIGIRGATFGCIIVSLIASIKIDNYYALVIGIALGCFTSIAVRNSRNYKHFFTMSSISVFITIIPTLFLCFFQLIISNISTLLIPILILSVLNALATGILSLGFLFIIESIFKVSTNMSLISLCDYNHPILKRLQLEAPGTYHHSLMVATLAEHAAIDVKLNPIKARACALFHDIGKLSRPEYFIENNFAATDLHSTLKPAISAIIIMSHVKDGIALGMKYKLGSLIMSAIEQHHGTDLVYYFYKKAMDESHMTGALISEKEFRYPGPKPTDKEVSLVSLADACEAACRSIEKPTPSKIDTMVWEILRRKVREGQLDNTDLSISELAKVRMSFSRTLSSMMHARITYPKDTKNAENENILFKTKGDKALHI